MRSAHDGDGKPCVGTSHNLGQNLPGLRHPLLDKDGTLQHCWDQHGTRAYWRDHHGAWG